MNKRQKGNMERFFIKYYQSIKNLIDSIVVTDINRVKKSFIKGINDSNEMILKQSKLYKKLIFIGNGASAAISSHQATDYWRNGGIRAITFNDASLLTCVSNDIGYNYVFEKAILMFADPGDILIAISSSGRSKNILRGVKAARKRDCFVITLSGFDVDNPLRSMGDINFYVPSHNYGHVEILHHSICHCILAYIVDKKNRK